MTNAKRARPRRTGNRRAVVAVVVLLLIAVALATSYSAMRSQTVTLNVRQNAMLGVSARQAALTGLTAGYREMHSPDWSGVDTTFGKSLGADAAFAVQYIAGDTTLTEANSDYEDSPYRVTLVVTGTATDPSDSRRVSQYTIRAVARLIPRAVPDEPSDWSAMQDYVFYQTKDHSTTLDIPCQIQGAMRLQGKLRLGRHYPDDWDAWVNYFYHLNQMRWNDYGDYRTVTGPIHYRYGDQDWYVHDTLTNKMSVSTVNMENDTANADWVTPSPLSTYQLFPGGPIYQVPTLSGTLTNRTLEGSVLYNPLGLYYACCDLTLDDNVTLRGTLICREELRIAGTNVNLEAAAIPSLYGESLPIQLPVATCENFEVRPGASCSVKGLVAAFGHLEVDSSASRGTLNVAGRVVAEDLDILEDTDWDALDWWHEFQTYLAFDGPSWIHFPVWMRFWGYHYVPTVQIKQGDDVVYHWYRPGETVFIPHTDDFSEMDADEEPGLRWELIEIVQQDG